MKHKLFGKLSCLSALMLILGLLKMPVAAEEIYINARAAIALDSKTKVVLFERNAHQLIPMASTTKIMTALVAIKYGDLDRKVEISSKAASIHGSTVGYKKGEMVSIRELVYGLMLRSGNDAAIAIAEGIAGSVEEFVKLMNEYAGQIGLSSTNFESPHGLDSQNHYTTAYDLALITAKAKESNLFNSVVGAKDVDGRQYGFSRSFHNINKILWQLPNATGVKTGYTGQAGKCLVTSVDIENRDVVIVVLNSNTRWKETKKINDYVMKNYKYKKLFTKGEIVGEAETENENEKIGLRVPEDIIFPMKGTSSYEVKVVKPSYKVSGPINKDESLGSVCIYQDGKKVYNAPLESDTEIGKKPSIKRWFKF
jgi:D-alanyl-D-alanine carboxypeptidase